MQRALDRIKFLTAVNAELTKERNALLKERDELAGDNVNLQLETMQWQNEWYEMKMATKSARKRLIYPKRSQRIYDKLRLEKFK